MYMYQPHELNAITMYHTHTLIKYLKEKMFFLYMTLKNDRQNLYLIIYMQSCIIRKKGQKPLDVTTDPQRPRTVRPLVQ